jgi:hypothetical protein
VVEPVLDIVGSTLMHVVDFLHSFAEAGVVALLREESIGAEPKEAEMIDVCKPPFKFAEHFRWTIGIMAPQGDNLEASNDMDCWIAPRAGARASVAAPSALWPGEVLLARAIDRRICLRQRL